ncbi:MAG: endonuclease/exonuclease/phosphatase family protein [Candidatus Riflemargulisbacteria bacterium]
MNYKLLIYNIRYGTCRVWKFIAKFPFSGFLRHSRINIEKITEFISKINPDIIGLIEVDSGSYRHYGENQAEFIAQKLGYNFNYNSKYRDGSRTGLIPFMSRQGNAFLTKQEMTDTKIHFFDKGVKRLVIELEMEEVVVFLLHLALSYRTRQWQLSSLFKLIKQIEKPVIVAGDFNMFWGEREMDLFLAATGLKNMNTNKEFTYPSKKPTKQLDFILHSPQIKVKSFKVCKETIFSDHLPVYCEFEVDHR